MDIRIFVENDLISSVDDYRGKLEDQRITLANFAEFVSEVDVEGEDYVILVSGGNLIAARRVTGDTCETDDGTIINDLRSVSDKEGKKIAKELGIEFDFPGWKYRKMVRCAEIKEWATAAAIVAVGAVSVAAFRRYVIK